LIALPLQNVASGQTKTLGSRLHFSVGREIVVVNDLPLDVGVEAVENLDGCHPSVTLRIKQLHS
jgi:hypothetical protein